MQTKLIEAVGPLNWGKFMLGRFDDEWRQRSGVESRLGLLRGQGWDNEHLLVLDVCTGEGAIFRPGGNAHYDLNEKHRVWVCPLFEPFLEWLYAQDLSDLDALPAVINLREVPVAMYGYRRGGGGEF